MATGVLRTSGSKIVDGNGDTVYLRGTCLGGWMAMENWMNGFPGRESQIRKALFRVLGQEKYDFFFDKFLEYFFTESDAKYLSSLGLNCVRLGFNYLHFEDDMNPFVIKEEGFKHLDRVIELCAKYNMYTILNMHGCQGGQNQDWHSGNVTGYAALWDNKHFQDRAINLWEVIAKRYRGNPWVAGYNFLNEPAAEEWDKLFAYYDRIVPAIQAIDPDHIVFIEGNTYSMDFSQFTKVFPNSVYAIHDYCGFGFPERGRRYTGTDEQNRSIRKQYERKVAFMRKHNVPVWNGEFGAIVERPEYSEDFEEVNKERLNMVEKQLAIYTAEGISWTNWAYKDLGTMSMVHVRPDSPWMKLLGPIIEKKVKLCVDPWAFDESHLEPVFGPLYKYFKDNIPEKYRKKYPWQWNVETHVIRSVRNLTMAEFMIPEWADYFEGKSLDELDALAGSWKLENCTTRDGLNSLMGHFAPLSPEAPELDGKVIIAEGASAVDEEGDLRHQNLG